MARFARLATRPVASWPEVVRQATGQPGQGLSRLPSSGQYRRSPLKNMCRVLSKRLFVLSGDDPETLGGCKALRWVAFHPVLHTIEKRIKKRSRCIGFYLQGSEGEPRNHWFFKVLKPDNIYYTPTHSTQLSRRVATLDYFLSIDTHEQRFTVPDWKTSHFLHIALCISCANVGHLYFQQTPRKHLRDACTRAAGTTQFERMWKSQ